MQSSDASGETVKHASVKSNRPNQFPLIITLPLEAGSDVVASSGNVRKWKCVKLPDEDAHVN